MGTRARGNEYEGETYRVRARSELTGVVSEPVLTPCMLGLTTGVEEIWVSGDDCIVEVA